MTDKAELQVAWRAKNPNYGRDWYARNPVKQLLAGARKRGKKGVPFTITEADIVVPEVCPILGIPLKRGVGKIADTSPSLDKIIPELGYVPGNIQVISNRANRIKHNASLAELIKVGQWAVRRLNGEVQAAGRSRTCRTEAGGEIEANKRRGHDDVGTYSQNQRVNRLASS